MKNRTCNPHDLFRGFFACAGNDIYNGTNQCDVFSSADNVTGCLLEHSWTGYGYSDHASGSTAMGTGAITNGSLCYRNHGSATGVTTTDRIVITPNADPTAVTGYAVRLRVAFISSLIPHLERLTLRFAIITSGSLTPAALTINWG